MAKEKLNKITAYQAEDGEIFTDKAEYLEHRRKLKSMAGIKVVAARINGDGRYLCDDLGSNAYVLDAEELAQFLFENASDLILVLQGKPLMTSQAAAV